MKALRNGHLLAISPGGVREALFSDESYTIMWGNRIGFAEVAIDAQVVSLNMTVIHFLLHGSGKCIPYFMFH